MVCIYIRYKWYALWLDKSLNQFHEIDKKILSYECVRV